MPVSPLCCTTCGLPVPLTDGDHASCQACQGVVPIPPAYQQLRRASADARARRREAERRLQETIDGHWSPWLARLAGALWVLVAIAVPVGFAFTGPWSPRQWVVLAGFLPSVFMGYLCVRVIARTLDPGLYLGTFQRQLLPRLQDARLCCGACGAPLAVEAEARAATCDYCHADSWVVAPSSPVLEQAAERHAMNLSSLDLVRDYRSFELRLFHWVWWCVWIPFLAFMWFQLPAK